MSLFLVKVIFKNASATDPSIRKEVIGELSKMENIRIKIFLHSLAFGALKPVFGDHVDKSLSQKQIEMTIDVMANSLIYWAQDLLINNLLVALFEDVVPLFEENKRIGGVFLVVIFSTPIHCF